MAEGYGNKLFTPRNIIIYIVVGALIYGAVYFLFLGKNKSDYMAPSEEMTKDVVEDSNKMTVALDAENDSNQSGTAIFTEANGKTTVLVDLDSTPGDVPQPAHIHSGTCSAPGAVIYPLKDVVGGKSETVLDVDLKTIKSQMPLIVNVHKSEAESGVYVSCGNFK